MPIRRKNFLFSPWFMGLLFLVLAIVMAFATYIENDYGAEVSRYFIYNTWWFEMIFLLVLINLLGQIIVLKLYKKKKLTIFLFHFSFALIIIGAAITRYCGIEGTMHIREGESSNKVKIVNNSKYEKKKNGEQIIEIPFFIKLKKFNIERYPGSNSPSSFKSDVLVIDNEKQTEKAYSIYMNHILKYRGFRFFQSSYDQDEKGTVLSVNKDRIGIFVTYTGYFMMIVFFILSLVNKYSFFRNVTQNLWKHKTPKSGLLVALFLLITGLSYGIEKEKIVIPKAQADEFGELLVQDQKGRTKPLYTLSHDIIRKISKKPSFDGLSSMQVFMGFYFDFEQWKDVPVIKISNQEIAKNIGVKTDYAAFTDFIDLKDNTYKLSNILDIAYSKPAGVRNKLEKEAIKIDERLNICFMIYRGDFLRIFPIDDSTKAWYSPKDAIILAKSDQDSLYLSGILNMYYAEIKSGNSENAQICLSSIKQYQQENASYKLPSELKIKAEIFYYKSAIFEQLFPIYSLLGLFLFIFLIYQIISRGNRLDFVITIVSWILLAGFVVHTFGLILRWYISEHVPMSNGYETMIFISWVTILAGFIFRKKSPLVLSATALLASLTLLVAHLSFMDPEITNLVPVLQSYWLTLHVSVITSSYAFLGLGAILGIICMILYSILNNKNKYEILKTIDELTIINYKTLIVGLYLLTIGTFLGAIWANESWGRYWGWDPKETWSLITIIVYSFVIHSRMIETFKDIFVFNLISMIAFSSVLMTYFGVNYYLSGLHSYASGDPVPIPNFVYITLFLLISLSAFASYKCRKYESK